MCQLKYGFVTDAKVGFVKVRFPSADDLPSPWLPLTLSGTHDDQEAATLGKDTLVACLMDEHADSGVCLGAIYSDKDTPPSSDTGVWMKKFSDGTTLSYDKGKQKLTVSSVGSVEVTTSGDANVAAAGNANVTGAKVNLGGGGPGVCRNGDSVEVNITSGMAAGIWPGTITGGSSKVFAG